MLSRLIVVIISQCICVPKHHVLHLNYVQFLFVNYITLKIGRKGKEKISKKKNKKKVWHLLLHEHRLLWQQQRLQIILLACSVSRYYLTCLSTGSFSCCK